MAHTHRNPQANSIDIEALSDELRGIARVEGKTHFIRGALPTEQVKWVRTKRKNNWEEGYIHQLIKAHPERITPLCTKADALRDPHPCGGCSVQHMPIAMQREEKQKLVKRLLAPYATEQVWRPLLAASDTGYRQKARLGVRYNKKANKVHVGFREARSHCIADITQCPVLDARVGTRLLAIADTLAQTSVPDAVPQIEVAMGDDGCALVIRHLRAVTQADTDLLIELAAQYDWQMWLQPGNYQTAHKIYPSTDSMYLSYSHPDIGVSLAFHPLDFTQVHPLVNRALVMRALDWLAPHKQETLFDLFSGMGNFAVPLARYAACVHAVDSDQMLVERCAENATRNQVSIVAHCLDLFTETGCEALAQLLAKHAPSAVLIDPPRTGCELIALRLAQMPSIDKILYVSCNPHTLARDTALLVQNGFTIAQVAVADMFPHTHHIETTCLFKRTE